MNDDLISRAEAIDAVGYVHPLDYNAQGIVSRIKALPSAEVFRIEHVFVDHDRDFDTMRDYFADGKVRRIIENAYEHGRLEAMRRGKWIFDGNFCGLNHHRCSECGKTEFRMSAYCPNCGAAMEGEDDAERKT